ncbi:MBG domain-containing protein [Parapedobacter deserti]|uniref:MBG domain-containing protein n=1 Tax=Parapedobacter deserti TaxID=1912957 RepID=A0ABV7JJW5_9SPHI
MKSFFASALFAGLLMMFVPYWNQAQTTIDFNNLGAEYGYGLTFGDNLPDPGIPEVANAGGFLFSINDPGNGSVITGKLIEGYGGSYCLYDNNANPGAITAWTIKKADGGAFQFRGIYLRDAGFADESGTITGYKNGIATGSVPASFSRTAEAPLDFSANPIFFDVDEIRIEASDINFYLDHFTYASPFSVGDEDPVEVLGIALVGSPTSTATTVSYAVTFSKNAFNVDITDFELTTTGSASGTITSVSGTNGSATYTVVVNNVAGEGSLRLDLKANTDIQNEDETGGTPAFTGGQLHYVGSCFTETFDQGETNGATTFSGNGKVFTLSTNWRVNSEIPNNGWGGSAYNLKNTAGTGPFTITIVDGVIAVPGLYLYLSSIADGASPTGSGSVTISGLRSGSQVYTFTKTGGFETNPTSNSGYTYIDFSAEGPEDHSKKLIDQLEISIAGGFIYLNLDNFSWCLDFAPPLGYTVSIDQDLITSDNEAAISFTFAGAEVGATYHYTFTSSGGGIPVSNSGTVTSVTDQVTGINLSDLNPGTVTLSVTLTDASDNVGAAATATVQKIENNAPVATAPTAPTAVLEDSGPIALSDDIGVADIDGDDQTLTFTVTGGTITLGTDGITFSGGGNGTASFTASGTLAAVNTALKAATFTPTPDFFGTATIAFLANDGYVNSNEASVSFPVTAVNDVPTVVGLPAVITVTEDIMGNLDISSSSFADVDSDEITVILSVFNGTIAFSAPGGIPVTFAGNGTATATITGSPIAINSYIGIPTNIQYVPPANLSGPAADMLTITANDGDGSGDVELGTVPINITAVNDAPLVTTTGGTTTFTEPVDGSPAAIAIDNALTVTDPDNTTLASAVVAITGNFQSGQDVLGFINDGSTMGNITGSFNAATGTLELTSAGAIATLAEWEAALRAVTYSNTSQHPNTANRTVSFMVDDGTDQSVQATKTVNVTAVNTAPVLTIPATIAVNEDTTTPFTGISFSDVDAGSGIVTTTFSVPSGSLSATSGGGVTVGGTASALTLSGTIADLNTFIAAGAVAYTPALNMNGDVTLTVTINDNGNTGSGGARQDSGTVTLAIAAVNDAPVVTAPATIAVDEDVPTALTGISFADVDAGSNPVTATFSVGSGTLSATSGGGIAVSGSGTGTLTLVGTIADLNAFVAASNLNFTTALNATSDVALTVSINDNGHTGSGGALEDATTITLAVTAVNDAPVNTVPAAQTVDQDGALVFSAGNGNLISVGDVDAGGGIIRVTLTASNGLLTLPGTTGLSFIVGSGANDGSMTFEGTIADINSALNGLIFSPTPGYNGAAGLQITTSDLGLSGSGGTQTATDTITITVNAINPKITGAQAVTPDGLYKIADVIILTVSFDQAVIVDVINGSPTLVLETGSIDREATYVSGSGSNTLTFTYTVQAGDLSADLDYESTGALTLNGATIRNASGDHAILTLPAVGGVNSIAGQHDIIIDGVAPAVTSVAVPANGYYLEDDVLTFTVQFNENVIVDAGVGIPYLGLTIGTTGVQAPYISGSGTNSLAFRYTVQPGEQDLDGVVLGSDIRLNGGTIRDIAGNDVVPILNSVAATNGVFVYAITPGVTLSTTAVSPVREAFTVSIAFTEPVTGFTTADLSVANATVSNLQTADNITYTALVTPVADGAVSIQVLADAAQNIGNNGNTASNTLSLVYDGTAPAVTSVAVPAGGTYRSGDVLSFTVHFSEDVSVSGSVPTLPISIGRNAVQAHLTGSTNSTLSFSYTVQEGESDTDGIEIGPGISLNGGALQDEAGNDASLVLAGVGSTNGILVDAVSPSVISVNVPANGYYREGDALIFAVQLDEAVTVNTTNGTPYLELTIGAVTVQASYVGGSDNDPLTFSYTVQADDQDLDGITLGNELMLDGGTIQDAAGNDALRALQGIAPTDGVMVYSVTPAVTLTTEVASPVNGPFVVTATFSEAVTGFTLDDITVSNGIVSDLQTSDNTAYTFLVTPAMRGEVQLSVAAGVAVNIANNGNQASNTLSVQFNPVITGITLNDGSFVYDGTAKSLAITGNLPAGTAVSYENNSRTDAGTQEVVATISGSNYETLVLTAALTVTPLELTVTAQNRTKTYGSADPELTYTVSSALVDGDAFTGAPEREPGEGVGMYAITRGTLSAGSNYDITFIGAALTITPAAITGITLNDGSFVYDGTAKSLAIMGNLPAGTVVSYENNSRTDAGTQEVVATISGSNYEPLVLTAVLTVTPLELTVTAQNRTKAYGSADPELTYTVSSALVDGDAFTGAPEREPGEGVGTYAITRGTLSAGTNYDITFIGAALTITPAAITGITLSDGSFVYDGTAKSLAVEGTLPEGTAVSYANNSRTDAGTQEVAATISGSNYETLVLAAALRITPAMRTLTFPVLPEKTYGAADFAAGAAASSGEEIRYASSDPLVAEVLANGRIRIVGAGSATITATVPENGNYANHPEISQVLTVGKAQQLITINAPAEVSRDAGTIQLDVSASSGLPVSLSIDDEQVATMEGTVLHIHRLGTVRITATQAGDGNHEAAAPVTVTVRVTDPSLDFPVRVHPAVSPNGDGVNEFLMIEGIRDHPVNRVTVISRNGTVVWEASGYDNDRVAFRGIGTGQQRLPAGTYFYVVELGTGGSTGYRKGYFVLRY